MSTNASLAYSLHGFDAPAQALATRTIAILGAGRVGTVLARGLVEAGYGVKVAGPGSPERIRLIVEVVAPGASAHFADEAVADADVVVLAVPLHKIHTVDAGLLRGKVVIDATNYWEPIDGDLPEFAQAPHGTSPIVESLFEGARMVKTLNHIGYHDIESDRRPPEHPQRRALAVASDDAEAAATAMAVIERLGFDALYTGPLASGSALEAGGPVFGVRLGRDEFAAALR